MNTIFWLVFLFILARSIWRLMERAGGQGGFDGPLGAPPTGKERYGPGSEEEPRLAIPEYLTRRSEELPVFEQPGELTAMGNEWAAESIEGYREPVVLTGDRANPHITGRRSRLHTQGALPDTTTKVPREEESVSPGPVRRNQESPFSDMLYPDQVVKGMAWSQILGPRGGNRRIYSNKVAQRI